MDLYKDLLEFLDELKQYREVVTNPDSKLLEAKRKNEFLRAFPFLQEFLPKKSKEEVREELREKLLRKSGAIRGKIIELTGKQYFNQFMTKHDMWTEALSTVAHPEVTKSALSLCIDATNEAIGKLKSDIENGIRDKEGSLIIQPQRIDTEPPKAFIAHGGKSKARDKLYRFLTALGVTSFIIEEEPKEGRSVNEQVEYYSEQADCAIILGTADDKELKDGKLYPRRNVYIEIGRFQEKFPNRIIYLLEEGASFPSDISEKLYTPFTQQSMDEALITVVRELKKFGLIIAQK